MFLSFLAFCCIRFLTLINNSVAIFQGTFSRHNYTVSDSPRGFVSVVSFRGFYESAAKLQTLNHTTKII